MLTISREGEEYRRKHWIAWRAWVAWRML